MDLLQYAECVDPKKNMGLYELVHRVEAKRDPLLMKVIRNVAHWTYCTQMSIVEAGNSPTTHYAQRGMWGRFVDKLFGMLHDQRGRFVHPSIHPSPCPRVIPVRVQERSTKTIPVFCLQSNEVRAAETN